MRVLDATSSMAFLATSRASYRVRQCTSPKRHSASIQKPHSRSPEWRQIDAGPRGCERSAGLDPKSASVGTPETQGHQAGEPNWSIGRRLGRTGASDPCVCGAHGWGATRGAAPLQAPVVTAGAGGDLARVVAGDSLGVIANRLGRLCRRSVGRWLVTAAGYGIERSERHGSGLAGRSGAALR